ncbi:hypothetical protein GC170_00965 [bacterium]|nr:hypothetical protein [bacterium]
MSNETAGPGSGGLDIFVSRALPVLAFLGLFLACHGWGLSPGHQYGFRDAGHFYYPLNQRVQMEWDAGRWPLWEPEENGGMPLAGNPTAAVFYPLKVVFFLLPYAWAARVYILVHQVLAWFAMRWLARELGRSKAGAWIAATIYAFGVPVLYQYCNVIFLIGAAWMPFGMGFGWRWIAGRKSNDLLGLAVTIAMQILGGDPQTGYLTLLCLFGLAFWEGLSDSGRRRVARFVHPVSLVCIGLLVTAGAIVSCQFPMPPRQVRLDDPGILERLVNSRRFWHALGWGTLGVLFARHWWRRRSTATTPRTMFGIGGAMALAAGLSAVQLMPVMEYNALSVRSAAEGPHDIFPFSLEPYRVLELVWPQFFGSMTTGNRSWLTLLPPLSNHKIWVPSLYHGTLALLLTVCVFGLRKVDGQTRGLSLLLVVSLAGSMGEFAGPLWILRRIPIESVRSLVGPPDNPEQAALRKDGLPRDGAGSPYGLMSEVFPGFKTFRYPSKLLTFTSLALGLMAGLAWDRREEEKVRRRFRRYGRILAISTLVLAIAAIAMRSGWQDWMRRQPAAASSVYGPLIAEEAWAESVLGLVQAFVVLVAGFFVMRRSDSARWAVPAMLLLMAADLALANARYVRMVPQALFEGKPKILALIEEAEKESPTPGGLYRIHRMPLWNPPGWYNAGSPDRVRDFVRWERATIQPKYGITEGVQYTITEGTTELYDYWWFFGPFFRRFTEDSARALNGTPGAELAYHPRRGYDMWNTRYFVVPGWPSDWRDDKRSYASFIYESDPLYPDPQRRKDEANKAETERWAKEEDVQIFRNRAAFPRAWIVHEMRVYPTVHGLSRRDREGVMTEILFPSDPFWFDVGREVFDPRKLTWIDAADQERVRPFMAGRARSGSDEKVAIDKYEPQRVEMTATLERPGLVILADVFYPGWKLTVDGEAQEPVRANRMMRGALVPSGTHKIVYEYAPSTFRVGGRITCASIVIAAGLAFTGFWRGRKRLIPPGTVFPDNR